MEKAEREAAEAERAELLRAKEGRRIEHRHAIAMMLNSTGGLQVRSIASLAPHTCVHGSLSLMRCAPLGRAAELRALQRMVCWSERLTPTPRNQAQFVPELLA
jgi:hypothetical protein